MVSFSRRGRRWPQGGAGAGGAGSVTVPRGQLILTGFAPQGLLTQPRSGGLMLVGHPPLPHMTSVTIGLGAMTITGPAPSANVNVPLGLGQLVLSGHAPNINDVLKPGTGLLSLTGPVPVADAGQMAQPGVGALSLTGHAPTVDAGGGLTSISEFAKTSSVTESLTLPANIIAGDVILFANRSSGFATTGSAVPADFTSINIQSASTTRGHQLSYKIADGDEGGTNITGLVGTGNDFRNTCLVIRGNSPITAVNIVDVEGANTDGVPSDQTITASSATSPVAVVAAFSSSGSFTPSFSTTADSEVRTADTDEEGIMMAKYYSSTPGENTIAGMTDGGSFNVLQTCYIECS